MYLRPTQNAVAHLAGWADAIPDLTLRTKPRQDRAGCCSLRLRLVIFRLVCPWPCAVPAHIPANVCHPRNVWRTRRQGLPARFFIFVSDSQ